MGSGDTQDLILKLSPGREPDSEQWAEAGTLGSLVVRMPQPSTLSLDQKHSADGDRHGQGDDGQDCEQSPGESVYPVCPLAGVEPWRTQACLFSGPWEGPKSVPLPIS